MVTANPKVSKVGLTPKNELELFLPSARLTPDSNSGASRNLARPKRILFEGALYHITSRGNERRKIVQSDSDRRLFTRTLGDTVEEHGLILHAWVLMDNHYHLLLETPSPNLSTAMKYLNGVYTQKFNFIHRRVGHLFQGRFKSILVDKSNYLLELCRYIVLNPVRAGMVDHPRKWVWSSYGSMAGLAQVPAWLETKWLLSQFGKGGRESQKK